MNLGEMITLYRKQKGMTIDDLAEKASVPKGTLNKIIAGTTKAPTLETIRSIAYALGKTLNDFDDIPKKEGYTHQEKQLIKKYRTLDGHGKEAVDSCLAVECRRMEEMRKAEEKKVLKPKAAVIDLRRYWESPSAGNGNDLTDGGYDIIQVPDTLTARLASYALTVSGDSMEPDLMDGDIVLVKAQETYEVGDIVVFSKNGDSYIKYAGEHCFESANPDYPDVEIGEDDSVRCFGVVLGKL